jgi:hypothetical protein
MIPIPRTKLTLNSATSSEGAIFRQIQSATLNVMSQNNPCSNPART